MGENATRLIESDGWVPRSGPRSGPTVASCLPVDPVLSHTDWPMFYIVMGWVVFLAITLAHYVKR